MGETQPLTIACIGCGSRAQTYAELIARRPDRFQIVAAADPAPQRVDKLRRLSGHPDFRGFASAADLLSAGKLADLMIVATQDNDHYGHACGALELGYNLLLEKPIATRADQVLEIERLAIRANRRVMVCFVLRFAAFYRKVKEIIDSGELGTIVSIAASEGVMPWHQAHSFVRGHWSVVGKSSPMIISKCCHDTDIVHWLAGRRCQRVASFGSLRHFRPELAPPGAPARCTDGCPGASECPYHAMRYTTDMRVPWLSMVYDRAQEATPEEIVSWLRSSPWGRCVYRCDNDAVDRQVLAMEFEGGVTGTFTMTAFENGRHIEVYGTRGVLKGGRNLPSPFRLAAVRLSPRRPTGKVYSPGRGRRLRTARRWRPRPDQCTLRRDDRAARFDVAGRPRVHGTQSSHRFCGRGGSLQRANRGTRRVSRAGFLRLSRLKRRMIGEEMLMRWVCFSVVIVLLGCRFAGQARSSDVPKPPNLLFVYTDDQRYDAVGVVQREQGENGRFPWFRTPNMDRLAVEGVRFRNAFVVNSLCAPSRAVNLTGRYSHHNGIASNFRPFPLDNVTHATLLRRAGYTTAYIGKWHMDSQRERPGFDFHASFIGHARYRDPIFVVDGEDKATKGWIDDLSTDCAIEFLRRQKDSSKPWSMVVGFKSPHGPFEPPDRAKQRFAGEEARAVPNLNTPAVYAGANRQQAASKPAPKVSVNLDYFRCISAADDCLGRLLDAIDELGLARNTVVIYTSDNGFYLGEHGLGDKRSAYDESLRVPFIVRDPRLPQAARGRVVDEMVLNLDLAPSLLDLAGVAAPNEMQGRSWRPLLEGRPVAWRESWFYEYFAEKQKNSRVPDITAVRTVEAKLIKYPGHDEWTELFDLKADPYEMHNLYRELGSSDLRKTLEAEHDRLAKEVGYRVPDYVDRPDWWGKPGGPDAQPDPTPRLRLDYDMSRIEGNRLLDLCGEGNHGSVHGATLVEGRNGQKALRLDGNAYAEVAKSKSLNPANNAWTVEATVKPERPDGVILARGGKTMGYELWLKEKRPMFSVVVHNKVVTVAGKTPVDGWVKLVGTITADRKATLHVDGRLVAQARLPSLIDADPNDVMQIGADLGSPVVEPTPPKFAGLIERVRIFSGQQAP